MNQAIAPVRMIEKGRKDHAGRPILVSIVAIGILAFAIVHLLRFWLAIRQWQWLESLPIIPPVYLASTGLFFGLSGLALALGLWFGKRWARLALPFFTIVAFLVFWIDRLFLRPVPESNTPFMMAITIVAFLLTAGVFLLPSAKQFFGARDER